MVQNMVLNVVLNLVLNNILYIYLFFVRLEMFFSLKDVATLTKDQFGRICKSHVNFRAPWKRKKLCDDISSLK